MGLGGGVLALRCGRGQNGWNIFQHKFIAPTRKTFSPIQSYSRHTVRGHFTGYVYCLGAKRFSWREK